MKNMEGCMNLDDLKKSLAEEAGLMPLQDAWDAGVCVQCREPALPKCYSDAGRREYGISGMCEKCFDELFKEEEDE
jgi:hypothetical protein